MKEAVWGQNLQFLLAVANWPMYALFAQWHLKARWICSPVCQSCESKPDCSVLCI